MTFPRLIPCLLLSKGGLVKTVRFRSPRYVGDPINAIRIFNEKEVDELIVLDIDASKERRRPDFALIEQIAGECFMPLCYGGGIQDLHDARELFSIGVEKIALQTAVHSRPAIIRDLASRYGQQAVVASVDVKRMLFRGPSIHNHVTGQVTRAPLIETVEHLVALGAGEIMLNSVSNDGMRAGMDLELIRSVCQRLPVPVIAVGGVGSLDDVRSAVTAGASAVGVGSFFVFHGPDRAVLITYPTRGELQALWA